MAAKKGIKKYYESRFVKNFVRRAVLFLVILFVIKTSIMLFFSRTVFFQKHLSIPNTFYLEILSGLSLGRLLNAFLFTAVIFIVYIHRKIPKIKVRGSNLRQSIVLAILALLFFISHYTFKYLVNQHLAVAGEHVVMVVVIKNLLNILFVLFLALAIFGIDFTLDFLKMFYKEILIFSGIFIVSFLLINLFELTWVYFSSMVAQIVGFLLRLTGQTVTINLYNAQGPLLGVGDFVVAVSAACSGIDSLQLFMGLYLFLFALDWNSINRRRMLLLFIPGVLGTILYNNLRIFFLMMVGLYISPEFAIGVFHTNVGWILFLGFFFVFWHFGGDWVYEKGSGKA